jgi:hypothetical protein
MCKPILMSLRNATLRPHAHRKVGESFLLHRWPWDPVYIARRILQKSEHNDGVMILVEWDLIVGMTAGILWIANFGQSGWVDISKDTEANDWWKLYQLVSNEMSLQAKYG